MTNIEICRQVFANWSTRPQDNESLFHPDAVLVDVVAGTHDGWPAMEAFFAKGLGYWQDMHFELHEFWVSDSGVACSWTMTAVVPDDRFGEDKRGRTWSAPGMSSLTVVDGKVSREADHWNAGSIAASLR